MSASLAGLALATKTRHVIVQHGLPVVQHIREINSARRFGPLVVTR
jgi:hypothetical protein